jgi:hypothetical protein
VSGTAEALLGVIAFALLVMAGIQVGAIIAGVRLARRVDQLTRQVERDLKPLLENLTAVSAEAVRTASVASRQIERVDHLFGELATRVDDTLAAAQQFVQGPARKGLAILSGVQAAMSALQGIRQTSRRRRDTRPRVEDESLFIG